MFPASTNRVAFTTGYPDEEVLGRYPDAVTCCKPLDTRSLFQGGAIPDRRRQGVSVAPAGGSGDGRDRRSLDPWPRLRPGRISG